MEIRPFFDPVTSTLTYLVFDRASRDAIVIDPVLDYDVLTSITSTTSLERIAQFAREHELRIHYALDTHAHADHLSGSQWLRQHVGAKIAIGARIVEVQKKFRDVLDLQYLDTNGIQFDRLLHDGENLTCGTLRIETIATPGHTPACVSYRIEDAVFTGDALFVEDYGTGRADFPGGDAEALFRSVKRLYALPDATRVFPGHDYQPNGRELRWETTIARSKQANVHLRADTTLDEFVAMRRDRDRKLSPPRLLYPSIQVNVDGGRLPPAHGNGKRYLTIPVSAREAYVDVAPEYVASRRKDLLVVDVREDHEFHGALGHVPGAQLVPLATVAERSAAWPRDAELVLVCHSGGRSVRAARDLEQRGFTHLYNLRGGMVAWNNARLPVEH
jgi:glyoxylase-like metal-dependent hydrolase (beta-lactamase superfamily II)